MDSCRLGEEEDCLHLFGYYEKKTIKAPAEKEEAFSQTKWNDF